MNRKKSAILLTFILVLLLAIPTVVSAKRGGEGGRGDGPVIYVRSQSLYFDSIVTADPLPMQGNFQKLEMGSHGLETDFGPGDSQYKGGRWWLDINENGEQDAGDKFFNCPLLGPGRDAP
ncbi:MAG: hypothetical protein PVF74_14720 [Anaerolineales bacterium]|jgi:hypothetical protein